MSPETKTTSIPNKPPFDLNPLLNDKTLLLYKADQKKVFMRALKNGGIVAVVMLGLIVIGGEYSKIPGVFIFSFVIAFVSCFILIFRLNHKYGIKNTYNYNAHRNSYFSEPYRSSFNPFYETSSNYYSPSTNPTTGLPMIGGGLDSSGTPYGCHRN